MVRNHTRTRPIAERVESYIAKELEPLPLTIRSDAVERDARALLRMTFPNWQDDEVEVKQEQDGVTNILLRCTRRTPTESTIVLVRVYGAASETMIYREREMRNFVSLNLCGYAPRLLKRFENGLLYEFVPGRVLSKTEMSDPTYARAVAKLLASWHRDMPINGQSTDQFWDVIKKWIAQIPRETNRDASQAQNQTEKILRTDTKLDWLTENLGWLESHAKAISNEPVFSHNDLLHANIIVQECAPETREPVVAFIDYEYGCANDMHFDIANHLLEFAGFECDWDALPTDQLQRTFVEAYLQSFRLTTEVSQDEVSSSLEKVRKYFAVSHFYWGVWALLQSYISKIDFDYAGYAERKLQAYSLQREKMSS